MLRTAFSVLVCVTCLAAAGARADDGWALTTADFKRQTVALKGFDENAVRVQIYGQPEPTAVPLTQFLQLDRAGGGATAQPVRGTWTLHLISGDRIGGEPTGIANDNLAWKSPSVGDLSIPLKEVRGLVRGQEAPAFDPQRTEDAVFLSNNDIIKGILAGMENGKFVIRTAAGDNFPVDPAAAKAVHLAAAGKPDDSHKRAFRVQLADGSAVTAPRVQLDAAANALKLTFAGAAEPKTVELGNVTLIEQLNGPVSWLSALVPDVIEYHPMFDVAYPPRMDRNYRGERLKALGRDYARGIGVHAMARLTWKLEPGAFKAFRTQYALNDDAYKGRVTVRVLLDGKVVHEQRDLGAGKISPVVLVDLGQAKTLTLEAHPGGDPASEDRTKWAIDTQARLNFLEPALLREKPVEKPVEKPAEQPAAKPAATTAPAATKPAATKPAATKPAPAKPSPEKSLPEATTPEKPTLPKAREPELKPDEAPRAGAAAAGTAGSR